MFMITYARHFNEDNLFTDPKWINLNWGSGKESKIRIICIISIVIWGFEWGFILEYLCGDYYVSYIIFPFKITHLLIASIIYWAYLWGLVGLRRTQYGRFTRNERNLWVKGYAVFWIVELVTVFSFVLIFAWLSWGPLILVPRYFIVPRRGLLLEFIFYSYLIFLTYTAKLNMRWGLWNFQLLIALGVSASLSYLLWRDVLILWTRDNMLLFYGARWRNIKLTGLVYSLSHEWWLIHSLGNRSVNFKYGLLNNYFIAEKYPFINVTPLMEYELNLWITKSYRNYRLKNMYLSCAHLFKLWNYYIDFTIVRGKSYFYPRRVGFIPKRLAIWEFLVFLKMWHQLIIFLWWLLYIFRIKARKGGSYTILAICHFNIYCCYLFGLLIYLLSYFVLFELVLRLRPNVFSINRLLLFCKKGVVYLCKLISSNEMFARQNEAYNLFLQIKNW